MIAATPTLFIASSFIAANTKKRKRAGITIIILLSINKANSVKQGINKRSNISFEYSWYSPITHSLFHTPSPRTNNKIQANRK